MTKDIRTMSHLLYPPLLDAVGLQSALTEYVNGFAERSGIQVSLDLPAAMERLDRDYELSLFRIVQECLTNIHRHSGSKTASIRIVRDHDGELILDVEDEGRGMPARTIVGNSVERFGCRDPGHARTGSPIIRDNEHRVRRFGNPNTRGHSDYQNSFAGKNGAARLDLVHSQNADSRDAFTGTNPLGGGVCEPRYATNRVSPEPGSEVCRIGEAR